MATRRPLVLVGGELKEFPAGDTMLSALLGATTVGDGLLKLPNPGSLAFLRINADNTVSALAAADFRSAIGAGTSSFDGAFSSLSGRPTITGTANQVIVTNGDGAAGNPTLSLPQSIATTSTPLFAGVGVNGAAASFRLLQFYTGGVRRINVGTDGAGESGANAGSNFQINRFDDAGNSLGAALFIQRSTGNVGIGNTNPLRKLDVVGDASGNGIRVTGTAGTTGAFTAEGTSVNIQADSAAATRVLVDAGSSNASGFVVLNGGSSGYVQLGTGGTARMQVFASGVVKLNSYGAGTLQTDATGNITANASPTVTNLNATGTVTVNSGGSPAGTVRNITISTAAPSGGADGDVWLQYTA